LVIAEALNIRNGPGDQFDIIAHLEQDSLVQILGTDSNQAWFFIEYGDGSRGWIYGGFVQVIGDLALAPNTEPTSLPDRVFLGDRMTWLQQQFNNCAPTAVTIALTYYGGTEDQNVARSYLRPSFEQDVSVDIAQMVDYINETQPGLHSVWRMGGNWTIIRQLVAAGFPVIIETSVAVRDPEPGWAGHNRVVVGYEGSNILTYDSFLGHGNYQGYAIPESELDEVWRHMNRHFMVIYPIEREAEVAYLMGEIWALPRSLDRAHNIALAEMRANPQNVFAHFNLGATYTALGQYDLAAEEFDLAFEISKNVPIDEGIPFRIFWYQFSIFEAYYQTGRYNEVIDNARRALQNMGGNATEELYYWLALGYAGRGQIDRAREELQKAIDFNPGYDPAIKALSEINAGTYRAPF
jgi:hypothetical protein